MTSVWPQFSERAEDPGFVFVIPAGEYTRRRFLALVGDLADSAARLQSIKQELGEAINWGMEITLDDLTIVGWAPGTLLPGNGWLIPHVVFDSAERVAEYTHALVVDCRGTVWATALALEAARALGNADVLRLPDMFAPEGFASPAVSLCWHHRLATEPASETMSFSAELGPLLREGIRARRLRSDQCEPTYFDRAFRRALESDPDVLHPAVRAWVSCYHAMHQDDRNLVFIEALTALKPLWHSQVEPAPVLRLAPAPAPLAMSREERRKRLSAWIYGWAQMILDSSHRRADDVAEWLAVTAMLIRALSDHVWGPDHEAAQGLERLASELAQVDRADAEEGRAAYA